MTASPLDTALTLNVAVSRWHTYTITASKAKFGVAKLLLVVTLHSAPD